MTIRQSFLRQELALIAALAFGLPLLVARNPWSMALFLIAIAGGGVALWTLHRSHLRQTSRILELKALAERQATGDLTHRPQLKAGGDELDDLLAAMDKMANHISGILSEIQAASTSMGRSVETFSASFAEISDAMVHVAGAMGGMSEAIASVETKCVQEDREAIVARERVEAAAGLMSRLEESALEIGRIVEVIGTVSNHTNLLALNASIEAARAGEAGKGFAVVASEVKELATQARSATVEIQDKVEAVRSDVQEAAASVGGIGEAIVAINHLSAGIVSSLVGGGENQAVGRLVRTVDQSVNHASERMDELGGVIRGIDATSKRLRALVEGFAVARRVVRLTADLHTGLSTMDAQHGRLFELIDQLGEALQAGQSDQALRSILPELKAYTVMHFAEEEAMMTERKVPGLDAHKQIHRAFVAKVESTMADMAAGKPVIATSLVNFLQDWLVQHIGGTDRKYAIRK